MKVSSAITALEKRIELAKPQGGNDSHALKVFRAANCFKRIGQVSESEFLEWWKVFCPELFVLYGLKKENYPTYEILKLLGQKVQEIYPNITFQELRLTFDLSASGVIESQNPLMYQRFDFSGISDLLRGYKAAKGNMLRRAQQLAPPIEEKLTDEEEAKRREAMDLEMKEKLVANYEMLWNGGEGNKLCYPEWYAILWRAEIIEATQEERDECKAIAKEKLQTKEINKQKGLKNLKGLKANEIPGEEDNEEAIKAFISARDAQRRKIEVSHSALLREAKTILLTRKFKKMISKNITPSTLAQKLNIQ